MSQDRAAVGNAAGECQKVADYIYASETRYRTVIGDAAAERMAVDYLDRSNGIYPAATVDVDPTGNDATAIEDAAI